MKKSISIAVIIITFLFGSAFGVFATSQYKDVKARLYPAIKVELNGQEVDSIKALNYEGSFYLPVKSITEYYGLNSTLKYDNKLNKITIGGPKYVNIFNALSKNFYQVQVNGNWGSTIQTNSRQLISNYYMGIDVELVIQKEVSLEEYYSILMKNDYKYMKVKNETDTKISNVVAKVIDYESTDVVGKFAIIHKDSDFLLLNFFVSKARFKDSDLKEFDKIINSFNIQ